MFFAILAAVAVVQSSSNPDRLEGTVEVSAPPERVIEVISDFEKWPDVFTDVKSAKVLSREDEILVRLDTKSGGHAHTFRFTTEADAISFEITDGHGGNLKINGAFRVEQTPTGSRVDGVFEVKVGGFLGRLLPDSKIRKMARAKLDRDLRDLERRLSADEERNQSASAAHVDDGVAAGSP